MNLTALCTVALKPRTIGLWLPIVLILAWGSVVLHSLLGATPWYDEAITLLQLAGNGMVTNVNTTALAGEHSQLFDGHTGIAELAMALLVLDVHPPLYYWLAEVWSRFLGGSPLAIRSLSIIATMGAIWATIAMLPRLLPSRMAAMAVLMASPAILFSAGNARDYGVSLLLCTLAVLACQSAGKHQQAGRLDMVSTAYLRAVILAGFAFITHYFTALVTAPALLCIIAAAWKSSPRKTLISSLIGVLFLLFAAPFLRVQLFARPGQYSGFTGYVAEIRGIFSGLADQITAGHSGNMLGAAAVTIAPALLLVAVAAACAKWRSDHVKRLHLTILIGYSALVLLLFVATDKTIEGSSSRYFVFALPSTAVLIGGLFIAQSGELVWAKVRRAVFAVAVACVSVMPFIAGDWRVPLPWSRVQPYAEERARYEALPKDATLAIVARNAWSGGTEIMRLPGDMQAYWGSDLAGLTAAFESAKEKEFVVIFEPPAWQNEATTFVLGQIDKLEACGFVEVEAGIWNHSIAGEC